MKSWLMIRVTQHRLPHRLLGAPGSWLVDPHHPAGAETSTIGKTGDAYRGRLGALNTLRRWAREASMALRCC